MLKNNKGITLIALVITIIVLLILAGVSIAMLTGSSGVLTKSNEADIANARGEACDRINTALNGIYAEILAESQGVTQIDMTAEDIIKVNGLDQPGATKIGKYLVPEPRFDKATDGQAVVQIEWVPNNNKFESPIYGTIVYVESGVLNSSSGSNYATNNNKIKYKVCPAYPNGKAGTNQFKDNQDEVGKATTKYETAADPNA